MSDAALGGHATVRYARGALYGLAAVSIWSGWIVVARLGLRTSLTPWDIAALRFGVAGILLLPYVLIKGLALERLGLVGLAAIVFGGAAPVLLANSGLLFAPAAHAGALFPGVMPLMVALLAATFLQETFTQSKKIGFTLILPGVLAIAWGSDGGIGSSANVGDVLFLGSGSGMGVLYDCDASGTPWRITCGCYFSRRGHAPVSAGFRAHSRDNARPSTVE